MKPIETINGAWSEQENAWVSETLCLTGDCWLEVTLPTKGRMVIKKSETANSTDDKYVSQAYSFTHKKQNNVFISRPYLRATDKVLIVDDFLADGQATHALIDLVHQAGGEVVGIGIAVEKGQQKGGQLLREEGYHLESIAIVESMDWETQTIHFREQPVYTLDDCNLKTV